MSYRLAIFDFDGTLADTFPFFLGVFNQIADKHGFARIEPGEVDDLRHLGSRELMRHVGMPAWKLPMASKSFIQMMREDAAGITLFEGIDAALRGLADAGVLLSVVSSNSQDNVRRVLGPELSGLVGSFDCGMSIFGKAGRIRATVKDAGVAPREAIYIGDQGTDAEAAHKAKVAFGAVHWGYAPIDALRKHAPREEFEHPAALRRIAQPN